MMVVGVSPPQLSHFVMETLSWSVQNCHYGVSSSIQQKSRTYILITIIILIFSCHPNTWINRVVICYPKITKDKSMSKRLYRSRWQYYNLLDNSLKKINTATANYIYMEILLQLSQENRLFSRHNNKFKLRSRDNGSENDYMNHSCSQLLYVALQISAENVLSLRSHDCHLWSSMTYTVSSVFNCYTTKVIINMCCSFNI